MMRSLQGHVSPAVILFALTTLGTGVLVAQERLRTGVELVSLSVTVTEAGRYVTGLERDEFEVYEDGVKQSISFFSREQQPIALAILLDTSASMDRRLDTAQEAAVGFARRMRPDDTMTVIDFDSQVRVLQTFTSDVGALEKAIRSTSVNGSTALASTPSSRRSSSTLRCCSARSSTTAPPR